MEAKHGYDLAARALRRVALDQQSLTTGFAVTQVTGTQIPYDYDTMPGNQPNTYANTIFLWQTSAMIIPTNTKPQAQYAVPTNQPNGSNVFTGLRVTEEAYLLGYATGASVKNICAMCFVPAGVGSPVSTFQPSVQVTDFGATSLSFQYSLCPGNTPQTDGDWVGLWEGQAENALYSLPPTWAVAVPLNSYRGFYAFNNITLLRGTIYTLGYFKGGYSATSPSSQTTLACSTTFST